MVFGLVLEWCLSGAWVVLGWCLGESVFVFGLVLEASLCFSVCVFVRRGVKGIVSTKSTLAHLFKLIAVTCNAGEIHAIPSRYTGKT